jgi:hypothetical protein
MWRCETAARLGGLPIAFTDVDLTDVHLVSLTGTYVGPGTALGTLTAVKNTDTTGTGSMGS